ncbi:PTS sugar transporter subunit IIBC [Chryseobacterium joostei]|uniref:PTS sugar transporter subunit IIBC n=1 Tax=Chryseobacterium joostei TaxID=112234 RepID=A0A1N7KBQ7_9FLAO|nr:MULTISPECIES: hypothetical protein [Chryseobacterium]AZB01768.1 PTS sugar transporter subunit IIBC [Chryseobacterium joostei]SIS59021.1 hypothetical protein SAMN05421768_1111 [Chryseobacterium joostei]HCM32967.1 PTS sugar transporter subunit IIBC [Chryseobacterium sp.]
MNFTYKKTSIEQAIALLVKNDIKVDDEEIAVILDLLYLISKNQKKRHYIPKEISNLRKSPIGKILRLF